MMTRPSGRVAIDGAEHLCPAVSEVGAATGIGSDQVRPSADSESPMTNGQLYEEFVLV